MFKSQLPTHSPSVQFAPKLTAPRPPGRGHAPHPISYAPGADPCANEGAADPAGHGELLSPPIPSVENPGPEPAVITRKNPALSGAERQTLRDCERTIRQGLQAFFEVGQALIQIQDGRLYRQTHSTFQAYCHECFGLSQSHAYRHIEGAKVLQHLSPIGDKPMPANEAQTRPLGPLEPEEQLEVWRRVLETMTPPKITAKVVELAVQEFLRSKEDGHDPQSEPPDDSVMEIDSEVVRDAAAPGSNEAKAGAGSPPASSVPTEFARPSGIRPSAGLSSSTREDSVEPPQSPTSVATVSPDAVAPPARLSANPSPVGTQPSSVAAPEECDFALPPEGMDGDLGEPTGFKLADGRTAHVRLLPGRRPTAAEIRVTLAIVEKNYPNLNCSVSQPDLVNTQRLVLECAAQINRLVGDWAQAELSKAVRRLGGTLNDLIARSRKA